MTLPLRLLPAVACLCFAAGGSATPALAGAGDLDALALVAVEGEAPAAEQAVRDLRAAGPRGLEALLALRDREVGAPRDDAQPVTVLSRSAPTPTERHLRLFAALDRVAAQKDARFAGLYWHTDEAEALRRAAAEGKPVLSLRLLGRLDEDASCANSRYFRTALYPDPALGRMLRERFVLHWRSMRPVPRITIDFGDGRVLERPITGNSVHLVLDARGRAVDAIPGLLGAETFRRVLEPAEALAHAAAGLGADPWNEAVRAHHQERLRALDTAWAEDLAALRRTHVHPRDLDDPSVWRSVVARHAADGRLSPPSLLLFAEKHNARRVNALTESKMVVEDPLLRAVRRFQENLAADGVRNEQRMHRTIHEWFAGGSTPTPPQVLAERIYRDVFLTPSEDPWLGLLPAAEYAALDRAGVRSEPGVLGR